MNSLKIYSEDLLELIACKFTRYDKAKRLNYVIIMFLFFLCTGFCSPSDYSQPCDPKNDSFKGIMILKVFSKDTNSFCGIKTNDSSTNLTSGSSSVSLTPPRELSFSSSSFTLSTGVNVNLTPTFSGSITSCMSLPNLPSGLNIGSTTCAITGAPVSIQANTNYIITASNSAGYVSVQIGISAAYCSGGYNFGGVCYRLAADTIDCQTTCSSFGNLGSDSIATSAANCQTILNSLLGFTPSGGYVQWGGNFPCMYETIPPYRGIYSTGGFIPNYSNYRAACPCVN